METWLDIFRQGFKIGLTPEEVLDLEYWQFRACVIGYQDRLRDQSNLNIVAGYWVAYYNNSKHPRKPEDIIQRQNMRNAPKSLNKPKPDIETYLRREHKRLTYTQNK